MKAEDIGKDREDAAKDFNYTDELRAGTKLCHIDSLSRNPSMVLRYDNTLLKKKHAQRQDDELLAIMHILDEKDSQDN